MSLDSIVQVTIGSTTVNVTAAGFGLPLICSANATFPQRYRTYTDLAGVVTDGFATTSPEYLMATQLKSQSPAGPTFAIGRLENKPTQVYTVEIATLVADTDYSIIVEGEGVTTTTVTVDSASLTDTALATALASGIDAVTGANFTAASGATTTVTATGDAAGNWFSLEVVGVSGNMEIQQTQVDPGYSADLTAIANENNDWYFILNPYDSEPIINGIAAYAEANSKIYFASTNDSRSGNDALGGADPLDDLKTSAYDRSTGIYHPSPAGFAGASWCGGGAAKDPGSLNWNFMQLSALAATDVTSTHKTNIEAKYGNFYTTIAGLNVTQGGGKVGSGEYIDVIRGDDWVVARIQEGIYAKLVALDKIPYTDAGIAIVQNEVESVMKQAVRMGIYAASPAPVVTVPRVIDVVTADKASRTLRDVNFTATRAGAVNSVIVTGVVSV